MVEMKEKQRLFSLVADFRLMDFRKRTRKKVGGQPSIRENKTANFLTFRVFALAHERKKVRIKSNAVT